MEQKKCTSIKKCLVKAFTVKNKGTKKNIFVLFDLVEHQDEDLSSVFVFR